MNEPFRPSVHFPMRKPLLLLVTALAFTAPARSAMTNELSAADRSKI